MKRLYRFQQYSAIPRRLQAAGDCQSLFLRTRRQDDRRQQIFSASSLLVLSGLAIAFQKHGKAAVRRALHLRGFHAHDGIAAAGFPLIETADSRPGRLDLFPVLVEPFHPDSTGLFPRNPVLQPFCTAAKVKCAAAVRVHFYAGYGRVQNLKTRTIGGDFQRKGLRKGKSGCFYRA